MVSLLELCEETTQMIHGLRPLCVATMVVRGLKLVECKSAPILHLSCSLRQRY